MAQQTIKSVFAFALELQAQVEALTTRVSQLESAQVALPLPSPNQASVQSPVRSVPTNKMLSLLARLGEYPDFDAAVAAGLTFEQARTKLDDFALLFKGVPQPKRVRCVHCEVGYHETTAEVKACWESKRQ